MNWFDLVPEQVAKSQQSHDLNRRIWQMWKGGATQKEIALQMGVSNGRVQQRIASFARRLETGGPPVERFLAGLSDDIAKLAGMRTIVKKGRPTLDLMNLEVDNGRTLTPNQAGS